MKNKIFCIFLLISWLGFYSCKDQKQNVKQEENKDSLNSIGLVSSENPVSELNLEIIKKSPILNNKIAENFVSKVKGYYEEMAQAVQREDHDKIVELQLMSEDIDSEYQKVKKGLNVEQQKQLEEWYNQLVESASK